MKTIRTEISINEILNNCIKNDLGCLIYYSSTRSIRINGTMISLARIVYETFIGNLGYKERIYRSCNNGNCLNPDHMLPSSPEDKFWSKVLIVEGDGCWEWLGATDGEGYGMFNSPKFKESKSHRISWELKFGEVPDNLWVLHKCDNPKCVKPSHLFLGNHLDNMKDKVKKERQSKLMGIRNGNCILTKDKVIMIREMYNSSGFSHRGLAKIFGVSKAQISRIIKRESWIWVD